MKLNSFNLHFIKWILFLFGSENKILKLIINSFTKALVFHFWFQLEANVLFFLNYLQQIEKINNKKESLYKYWGSTMSHHVTSVISIINKIKDNLIYSIWYHRDHSVWLLWWIQTH